LFIIYNSICITTLKLARDKIAPGKILEVKYTVRILEVQTEGNRVIDWMPRYI